MAHALINAKNGQPFKTEAAAKTQGKRLGLATEVIPVTGGFALKKVTDTGATQVNSVEDRSKGKQLEIAKRLFHAAMDTALGRRYSDSQLEMLTQVMDERNYTDAPITAFNTVACRTQSVIGGGQFGEDIDVPLFAQNDIVFMVENIFSIAVNRVCSAERRFELQQRQASYELASKYDHNQARQDNQPVSEVTDYIDALDLLYVELAKLWDIYAQRNDRVNKKMLPWGSQVEDSILNIRSYLYDYRSARIASDKAAEQFKREQMLNARARAQAASFNL